MSRRPVPTIQRFQTKMARIGFGSRMLCTHYRSEPSYSRGRLADRYHLVESSGIFISEEMRMSGTRSTQRGKDLQHHGGILEQLTFGLTTTVTRSCTKLQ